MSDTLDCKSLACCTPTTDLNPVYNDFSCTQVVSLYCPKNTQGKLVTVSKSATSQASKDDACAQAYAAALAEAQAMRAQFTCLPGSMLAECNAACPNYSLTIVDTLNIGADPDTLYSYLMRIRGVVELQPFSGGTDLSDGFYQNGSPSSNLIAFGKLEVSNPAQTYYLNKGVWSCLLDVIDYQKLIQVQGDAVLTLTLQIGLNGTPVNPGLVANVLNDDLARQLSITCPFWGQFIQLDSLSLTAI